MRHRTAFLGRLGAYLLVVAIAAIGFRADRYQSYRLCEVNLRTTMVLRSLINRPSAPLTLPEGADPALRSVIDQAQKANEDFRSDANRILVVTPCHKPWP